MSSPTLNLLVVISSTRPGRIGGQVGLWVTDYAKANTAFDVSVADLAEINLPLFDEPNHPMMGEYTKDHTKAWSKLVQAADAFVIVTPEYNYTMPPSLLNALDYLHHEWKYKPAAFVGYGGTGGLRSIQTARLIMSNLSVMPIPISVNLMGVHAPAVTEFKPDEKAVQSADRMFAELSLWAKALKPMRPKSD